MIISVSRWNLNRQDAEGISRDVASILREQGATTITCGVVQIGQHAGRVVTTVTYPDWDTYGKAMASQEKNQKYQSAMQKALPHLIDRQVVSSDTIQ